MSRTGELAAIAFAIFLSFLVFLYSVYVELLLWTWFAVPLGAPVVGYWHIAGLGLLAVSIVGSTAISLRVARLQDSVMLNGEAAKKPVGKKALVQVIQIFVAYVMIHMLGWVFRQLM